eukprot:CAMPEP_0198230648 /NCGR_PEP_ID=MMETSP1445-20131203/114780_1 /TAXON_ID=36898 /ORGANISM="Pyramimonas sp., Strain CCMP2087" /LENGTH=172 /DNA_ID=CAMNT_0043911209 /DNA_START=296 /DNA_END=815 /DNA_ORIENTATION=+
MTAVTWDDAVVMDLGPERQHDRAPVGLRFGGHHLDGLVVVVGGQQVHQRAVAVREGLQGDVVAPSPVLSHLRHIRLVRAWHEPAIPLGALAQLCDNVPADYGVLLAVVVHLVGQGAELAVPIARHLALSEGIRIELALQHAAPVLAPHLRRFHIFVHLRNVNFAFLPPTPIC